VTGYLLDENLPANLGFEPSLPVVHSRDLGDSQSDAELWDYAKENDLVVVTKDADFSDRILISEPPPKVVHLRFGNMRLKDFKEHLQKVWSDVEAALEVNKLVNVYLEHLEEVT